LATIVITTTIITIIITTTVITEMVTRQRGARFERPAIFIPALCP
jgi:hypothetical protein